MVIHMTIVYKGMILFKTDKGRGVSCRACSGIVSGACDQQLLLQTWQSGWLLSSIGSGKARSLRRRGRRGSCAQWRTLVDWWSTNNPSATAWQNSSCISFLRMHCTICVRWQCMCPGCGRAHAHTTWRNGVQNHNKAPSDQLKKSIYTVNCMYVYKIYNTDLCPHPTCSGCNPQLLVALGSPPLPLLQAECDASSWWMCHHGTC